MAKVLVFQHVAYEILGTLDPLLKSYGVRIRYVNFGRHPDAEPSLDGYGGLIVLGGPMNVDQVAEHPHLATEQRLIQDAIARELPVLGICLGAQLVAKALGGEVRRSPEKEIGWYDLSLTEHAAEDPVLRHFESPEPIFQWHGDSFELPPGAVHLASTRACPQQAFRFGESVWGLQFHLEVDEPLIERWLGVPAHRAEIAATNGEISADAIRRETPKRIARLKQLSELSFESFVRLLGGRRRRPPHPHR